MMRRFLASWVLFAAVVAGFADEGDFSQSISPEDFKAAGLDRLSPAERKRLDELVTSYKNGIIAAARRSAEEALSAKRAAESEVKAAKAEVAESKKSSQGFFAKAKVMLVPGTTIEYAEIKTTIVDNFEGWDSRTIFVLANGQRWQVANAGDHYFTPSKNDIEVQIRPSALGGFWMYFPTLKTQVRVKLLGR